MEHLFRAVLKHRRIVVAVFLVLTVLCGLCVPHVKVDSDMSDYLPPSASSKQDLDLMKQVYGNDITNARVYITGIDQASAKQFADELKNEDAVLSVTWLGDEVDTSEPIEVQDQDTVKDWYHAEDNGYLISAVLTDDVDQAEVDHIRSMAQALPGAQSVAIDGAAVSNAANTATLGHDMAIIMLIAVVTVLVIVMLNTTSYLHPFIMLLTIGIAIVLNMGTNIFRGTISNITQLVASVLQLAVSMDYSIVLLTNYGHCREETNDPFDAMVAAMTKSFPVILSSAAVTFFGFLSLSAMQFLIGADMGIALAKGIVCSFFCITLLMPCILYDMRGVVEKTTHKPFFKSFKGFARFCTKGAVPALIIAAVACVPAYLASGSVSFTYGSDANMSSTSQVKVDGNTINSVFGESQSWAIMVPEGQWSAETQLVDALQDLPTTKSVLAYENMVGDSIPVDVAKNQSSDVNQLISGGYSRIVLTSSIPDESKGAFDLVDTVRGLCRQYFGDDYHLAGNAVSYADIKAVTTSDTVIVRLASVLAIGVVLLLMFKSISLPIILIMAIEVSIWINESVPYFTGEMINFVAFLVIDAVQLGAAVDYAIIYTEEYLARRRRIGRKEASITAIEHAAQPIITSSSILILACLGIYFGSSSPMIQQVGMLIARGAFISVILIFFVLPLLFRLLDGFVRHTSYKIGFFDEKKAALAAADAGAGEADGGAAPAPDGQATESQTK